MAFLKRLFGSKEVQFQERVLSELKLESAAPGEAPLSIRFYEIQLDLKELYTRCEQNQVQSSELIQQFFSWPSDFARKRDYEWNVAESLLRPQLVPANTAKLFDIQLFPFADSISTSVAISENGQLSFVRTSDLKKWNVSPEELLNRAITNLDSDPAEMEVTVTDGTDRFIGLETRDGFDAARILLPRVRDFAAVKLGSSYYAGIPNRDFLILWSKDCSVRFQEYALEKIDTDYSIQSHPLTRSHFEVNEKTISLV